MGKKVKTVLSEDIKDYTTLLKGVKARIHKAQYEALRAVNRELVQLYWDIGRMISKRQGQVGWGRSVVEKLAHDLQNEFPGISGFSARNIWYMRKFHSAYEKNPKLQPLVAEIGWTHNLIILDRCKDDFEREFYIRMTRKFGWTKNILGVQIDNQAYQKTLLNQTNFDQTVSEELRQQAKLAVRDEYLFDFLELGEQHSERRLEDAILSRVETFLREMGSKFAFLGSQYRIEVDDQEYFIDLLLYHRTLRCLVAVELKIGEFKPEYVGKMQFYLSALDDQVRIEGENSSIGIILCRTKKRMIVEYALRDSHKPIGISTYRVVKRLPKELSKELPSTKEIEKILLAIEE